MLDEWFFHDLTLENGEANFRETGRFLVTLQDAATRLVVPDKKRWRDKAFRLIGNGIPQVRLAGRLFNNILRDSDRTVWTTAEEMQLVPDEVQAGIPDEDIYLIRAYVSSGADLLVTSDTGLYRACDSSVRIVCQLRDNFLKTFAS